MRRRRVLVQKNFEKITRGERNHSPHLAGEGRRAYDARVCAAAFLSFATRRAGPVAVVVGRAKKVLQPVGPSRR